VVAAWPKKICFGFCARCLFISSLAQSIDYFLARPIALSAERRDVCAPSFVHGGPNAPERCRPALLDGDPPGEEPADRAVGLSQKKHRAKRGFANCALRLRGRKAGARPPTVGLPQNKTMHEEWPGSRRLCNSRGIGALLLAVRSPCARRWSLHELLLYGRALADDPCTPPQSGSMHSRLRSDGAGVATRSTDHLESMSLACNNELAHVAWNCLTWKKPRACRARCVAAVAVRAANIPSTQALRP